MLRPLELTIAAFATVVLAACAPQTEAVQEVPSTPSTESRVPVTLETASYNIYPVGESGAEGTVQITQSVAEEGTTVAVTVRGLADGPSYPAHFHRGDCGSGGPIVYPLESLPGGPEAVVTFVDAAFGEIARGDLYINVHRSPENLQTIVACGEVGLDANDQ